MARYMTAADKKRYAGIYLAYVSRDNVNYDALCNKTNLTIGRISQIVHLVDEALRARYQVSGLRPRGRRVCMDPARVEMLRKRLEKWVLEENDNGK
jgi:hypothetical protein